MVKQFQKRKAKTRKYIILTLFEANKKTHWFDINA